MTKTQFTISEASRITGKSRTTLRTYLRKSKLSAVNGHGDQRLIDGSELCRVFGNDLDFSLADPAAKRSTATGSSKLATSDQSVQSQLEHVQQQLDREIEDRRRERQQLEHQVDELHNVLKRTQEGHTKAMQLLEDRSSRDWEKPLRALQSQVANQQKQQQELKDNARRKIAELQQALDEERSKSLLARLFG